MKPAFSAAIARHYGMEIVSCEEGPRQYVAETFILTDAKGEKYFCKLTDKPLFITEILRGLPLVAQLREHGIERVCHPVQTADGGFHAFEGDTLIVLHTFIPDAKQSYDYDAAAFGALTAQIHSLEIKGDAREDFIFPYAKEYAERFDAVLAGEGGDDIMQAYRAVLKKHEAVIRDLRAEFDRLAALCKNMNAATVLTHGDAPGNVLVGSAPDDIHIIDWDEALLTAPERDIWMIDHVPGFMEGYNSLRPDFRVNANLRSFYVLKYYFQRNMHYFAEILKEPLGRKARMDFVEKLDLAIGPEGWMTPRLDEVRANRDGKN